MTTLTQTTPMTSSHMGWFSRAEAWLDSKGKGAWIAATVLGFIFFWPVGLAFLFYMIWSKRMFNKSCSHRTHMKPWAQRGMSAMSSTGNKAFDAYKADTLRRLEEEQTNFEAFLERLREAKDKAEFDDFMDERAKAAKTERGEDKPSDDKTI